MFGAARGIDDAHVETLVRGQIGNQGRKMAGVTPHRRRQGADQQDSPQTIYTPRATAATMNAPLVVKSSSDSARNLATSCSLRNFEADRKIVSSRILKPLCSISLT